MSAPGPPLAAGLRLDDLLRNVPAGVVIVDAGSRAPVYANPRWGELAGDRPPLEPGSPLARSLETGAEILGEERVDERPDGETRTLEWRSSACYDDDGQIIAGVLVVSDITAQRASRLADDRAAVPGIAVRLVLVGGRAAAREALAAALRAVPGFDVAGEASSPAGAVALLEGVDVALVDDALLDGDGIEFLAQLREASPDAKALVLGGAIDRARIARAIDGGAAAALDGSASLAEVVDAVRRLAAGESPLALDDVIKLLRLAYVRREEQRSERVAIESLTPREREVLQALGAGLDGAAVAARLGVSIRTERNHVASILGKLGVHTQLQAVLVGLRQGLVQLDRQ
jgi:DNA-binding NarL/FixJ family response regulator